MSAYLVIVVVVVIVLNGSSHAAPDLSWRVESRAVASSPGVELVGHHPGSLNRAWSGASATPSGLHPLLLCSEVHGHSAWWREVLLLWDWWRRRHAHHQVWAVFRLKYNGTISRTI